MTFWIAAETKALHLQDGDWIWWMRGWHEVVQRRQEEQRLYVALRPQGDSSPMPYTTVFHIDEAVLCLVDEFDG